MPGASGPEMIAVSRLPGAMPVETAAVPVMSCQLPALFQSPATPTPVVPGFHSSVRAVSATPALASVLPVRLPVAVSRLDVPLPFGTTKNTWLVGSADRISDKAAPGVAPS